MRLVGTLALFASLSLGLACGGTRTVAGTGTGDKSGGSVSEEPAPSGNDPVLKAVLHLALEFEGLPSDPVTTRISLVETNEVGANTRHDLGVFEGECKDVTPDVRKTDPKVFLAFHCQPFGTQRGVLVHILHRRSALVLLRAWLGTSKPSFDDFDQIEELPPFPVNVPLTTDYGAL